MATFSYKGHEVFYTKEGQGAPILFIHGLGGNSINWLYQRNAFKQHYQVIAVDLPGHGKSGALNGLTYHDYHKLLYQLVVEELQCNDLLLCGISMGGRVALDFAYYHPQAVHGIVIADTYAGMDEKEKTVHKTLFDLMIQPGKAEEWVEGVIAAMGFDSQGNIAKGFQKGILNNQLEFMHSLFTHGMDYDQRGMLPSITVPALIMHGERDRFIPLSCAQDMHNKLIHSELVIVENSGHLPNVEQPKVFSLLMGQFIQKIGF